MVCGISTVRPTSIPFFQRGIPWVSFFLTIDVLIKVRGISLNITNQIIHVEVMLLPNIGFDFFLKVSNLDLIFAPPVFFAFA